MPKLIEFEKFRYQLVKQDFSIYLSGILIYLLPLSELVIVTLLLVNRTRFFGLILSAILLLIFSIYVALVVVGFTSRIPCSCGGILESMGWKTHLAFNVSFLSINVLALLLHQKERRLAGLII
ncbi:MAG: hypothetical protein EON58_09715 [Alphaproteobacteria bacterium]|nr:MAG: hypothetical protein EON58_09715 [Alphaproteobacteria bacterium]